jgi:hypothetical protein
MTCPYRLRAPEPPESAVLAAVLQALSLHPKVAWACRMNTGAGRLRRRVARSVSDVFNVLGKELL